MTPITIPIEVTRRPTTTMTNGEGVQSDHEQPDNSGPWDPRSKDFDCHAVCYQPVGDFLQPEAYEQSRLLVSVRGRCHSDVLADGHCRRRTSIRICATLRG